MLPYPIHAYWFRSGRSGENFGDQLTPLLLSHLGIRCKWSPVDQAELVGIGSILEQVPDAFAGLIWSSGLLYETTRKTFPQANVLAVRGRLTLERIDCDNKNAVCLGDAGLLCHLLWRRGRKKFKLGLIPHYVDVADPIVRAIQSRSNEVVVIDVGAEPREVIDTVGQCEHVLSSSLHGLILADSLGVPNRWMELNRGPETVLGAGFKFRDYYSALGISDAEPLRPDGSETLDVLLPLFSGYHRPGLAALQDRLLKAVERIREFVGSVAPEKVAAEEAATNAWCRAQAQVHAVLAQLIPSEASYLLVDDDQFRHQLNAPNAIPFLQKDGAYWGPPADDAQAIWELERLRKAQSSFIVFALPAFWWIDHYSGFLAHLRTNFRCVWDDENLLVFDLRTPKASGICPGPTANL